MNDVNAAVLRKPNTIRIIMFAFFILLISPFLVCAYRLGTSHVCRTMVSDMIIT